MFLKLVDGAMQLTLIRDELQNDFLIPFFTVYQNIQLASQIQNKKDNFHKRIDEILEWLGLRKIKNDLGLKEKFIIKNDLRQLTLSQGVYPPIGCAPVNKDQK